MTVESLEVLAMWSRNRFLFWTGFLLVAAFGLAVKWGPRDRTVYAAGYSDARFRSIRIGMTKEEVTRVLGEPLSIEPAPGYVVWVYAPDDYRNPRQRGNGPSIIPPQTSFRADPAGKIVSVDGVYLDLEKNEFLGHQLADVRRRFGDPLEVYSAPDRDVYWYSKMDGVKGHFVRTIEISTKGSVCEVSDGCIGYYVGREDERNLSWIEWLEIRLQL
jgi:outer membrane protein assembly factor BamE (lipoprotein component of BamABCDE complex)